MTMSRRSGATPSCEKRVPACRDQASARRPPPRSPPGVDLIVDHSLLGSGTDAAPIIERVSKLLNELLEGQTDDRNRVAVET
jgi:hypothetical protein